MLIPPITTYALVLPSLTLKFNNEEIIILIKTKLFSL